MHLREPGRLIACGLARRTGCPHRGPAQGTDGEADGRQVIAPAWANPAVHNSLKPADLIVRVEIPVVDGLRSAYLQVSQRSDLDRALVSCAAAARVSGKTVRGVRIVLGAVAPVPWQVAEANRFMEGRVVNDDVATQAANLVLRRAAPLSSNGYKLPIARALIRRSLTQLVA